MWESVNLEHWVIFLNSFLVAGEVSSGHKVRVEADWGGQEECLDWGSGCCHPLEHEPGEVAHDRLGLKVEVLWSILSEHQWPMSRMMLESTLVRRRAMVPPA